MRSPLCCGTNALTASCKDRFGIGNGHDNRLHVLTQVRFFNRGSQFGQERLDFAEGRKYFTVSGAEGISINSAICHKRSGHVPIPDDHSEPCVTISPDHLDKFFKSLWIKFDHEPVSSLAQYFLTPEIEK